MDKKATQKNIEQGLLVSRRVNLVDVRLLGTTCKQEPGAIEKGKKEYVIDSSVTLNVNEDNKFITVFPKFTFTAFTEQNKQKPVISIEASFVLAYTLTTTEGLTKKGYEEFANMNGTFNAWPYWREFVQATIARMGLPPLTIPVYRLAESAKKLTKAKKAKKAKA